ncbi:MAG: RraA family protein [Chloroflexi bacterium]|nr:MAG: RraA family protein [Chloroflexota bacterium]
MVEKLYPYTIPIKEMVQRYEMIYTAAINDIFQSRNLHNQWLGPDIKCITKNLEREVVAGFAFTVQWISDPLPDERVKPAARMVESYAEDSIIVVDTGADQVSGFWGELATTICVRNGVRGAVINGGAKDTGFVKKMGFPIFCKFSSPVDGFYRSRLHAWQVPIWFNGVLINPGDFMVGDSDGVLVIPQDIAEEVLLEAENIREMENLTRGMLKEGISAVEASEKTGRKDL